MDLYLEKEPHCSHQSRILFWICLQDLMDRDEIGKWAIDFGDGIFGKGKIGFHNAAAQNDHFWFIGDAESPDSSLQFRTDLLNESSCIWLFFCPTVIEIIEIMKSKSFCPMVQGGAGPEIFKTITAAAVTWLWRI